MKRPIVFCGWKPLQIVGSTYTHTGMEERTRRRYRVVPGIVLLFGDMLVFLWKSIYIIHSKGKGADGGANRLGKNKEREGRTKHSIYIYIKRRHVFRPEGQPRRAHSTERKTHS